MIYFVLNILPSVVCFDDPINFSNNKKKKPSKYLKNKFLRLYSFG